jgi:glutathione synthase/RimK-type ligase-like ATP-grasp enzyme
MVVKAPRSVLLVGGWSYNQRDRETKQEQLTFMEATLGQDTHCYMAFMDDLRYIIAPGSFQVYDTRNKVNLDEIDIVFIRGLERVSVSSAYYLSRFCVWSNKSCISDYSAYMSPDKVTQNILFLEYGAPFLKTLYCPDNSRLIFEAEKTFGHPYILKALIASHGDHNYLIRSRQEAEQILADDQGIDFLAQEFCPNDHDYRLLILGKRHLLFKRQGGDRTHLNNTSKGGRAIQVSRVLPEQIVDQSEELAKALGLMIAGVDIIQHRDTGELYFLEVNVQPQLRTGAFLPEKKVLIRKMFEELYLNEVAGEE